MSSPVPVYRYAPDLDECSALALAIASHLNGLTWATGKTLCAVYPEWPDAEVVQDPPAVAVMPIEDGVYSAESGGESPTCLEDTYDDDFGAVLWQDGEFTTEAQLVLWTTDTKMRSLVTRAVREAFQQRHDRSGVKGVGIVIPVPRYFGGARPARVTPKSIRFVDDGDSAERRKRIAYMTVTVQLPLLHVESAAEMDIDYTLGLDSTPAAAGTVA